VIKVNLLKSAVQTRDFDGSSEFNFDAGGMDGEGTLGQVKKIALMFSFTILIFCYEKYNISNMQEITASLTVNLKKHQSDLAKLKAETGDLRKVKSEIGKIQEKIDLIQKVSGKRLKELKALDYLQSIIPDGMWLKSFNYDGKRAKIKGVALTDRDLNDFVSKLEDSNYFEDVLLINSIKDNSSANSFKVFELSSGIGGGV